jgi:hypothetical protein
MTARKLAANRQNQKLSNGPATLQESLMGPSPYERAAEIAPTHRNTLLMRRMQDSNFREVWRVSNLLLKVKRQAREEGSRESPSRSWNVVERTGFRSHLSSLSDQLLKSRNRGLGAAADRAAHYPSLPLAVWGGDRDIR